MMKSATSLLASVFFFFVSDRLKLASKKGSHFFRHISSPWFHFHQAQPEISELKKNRGERSLRKLEHDNLALREKRCAATLRPAAMGVQGPLEIIRRSITYASDAWPETWTHELCASNEVRFLIGHNSCFIDGIDFVYRCPNATRFDFTKGLLFHDTSTKNGSICIRQLLRC